MARNTPAVETNENPAAETPVAETPVAETLVAETPVAAETVKKNRQVNATISGELYDALDDHRWSVRIDRMPKLVAKALQEYAENHGLMDASGE